MDDNHDSWLSSTFGVNLDDLKNKASEVVQSVEQKVEGAAETVKDAVAPVVQAIETKVEAAAETVKGAVAPVVQGAEQAIESTVETVKQAVAPTVRAIEQKVDDAVEAVEDTVAPVVQAVEQKIEGVVDRVKEAVAPVIKAVEEKVEEAGTPSPELLAAIQSELTTQIAQKTANPEGLIDQLNELESYTTTDPSPVPDFPPNIDPKTLANDIKEKQFAVSQLEGQRIGICKQARADARQATAAAKSDLSVAVFGGPGAGGVGAVVLAIAKMSGGALGLLLSLCTSIIVEHETYRKLRDTIRSIVTKAHSDLTSINTNITIERNKLVAMKVAAGMSVDVNDLPNAPG